MYVLALMDVSTSRIHLGQKDGTVSQISVKAPCGYFLTRSKPLFPNKQRGSTVINGDLSLDWSSIGAEAFKSSKSVVFKCVAKACFSTSSEKSTILLGLLLWRAYRPINFPVWHQIMVTDTEYFVFQCSALNLISVSVREFFVSLTDSVSYNRL